MQDIYITGGAMTAFGRHTGVLAPELAQQAILKAMADAGVEKDDIQAIYCANVLGGMILFSILGQRRDRKKREAMISAIKKHDRVQTIGGVIGSVVEVKPDYVVLKVDEASNTRITFARAAVQQVLSVSPESSAGNGNGGSEKA